MEKQRVKVLFLKLSKAKKGKAPSKEDDEDIYLDVLPEMVGVVERLIKETSLVRKSDMQKIIKILEESGKWETPTT